MRVRTPREPPAAILEKASERMGIGSLKRAAQRHRPPAAASFFTERAVAARIGEQGESLIVEIETCVADLAVNTNDGRDGRIRGDEMLAEIVERVPRCFAPGAVPADPASFAIGERLAGDDARAVGPR